MAKIVLQTCCMLAVKDKYLHSGRHYSKETGSEQWVFVLT